MSNPGADPAHHFFSVAGKGLGSTRRHLHSLPGSPENGPAHGAGSPASGVQARQRRVRSPDGAFSRLQSSTSRSSAASPAPGVAGRRGVQGEISEYEGYEDAIKNQLEFQAGTTRMNRERMENLRNQLRKFQQITTDNAREIKSLRAERFKQLQHESDAKAADIVPTTAKVCLLQPKPGACIGCVC